MIEKDKSILIRLSQELADKIQYWADKTDENKSALIRKGVEFYIQNLSTEKQEVQELIRAIIITKLDMIQEEFQKGKLIVFNQIIPVQKSLNCMICKDDEGVQYIVYQIIQTADQTMLEAIDQYAKKLYSIWRSFHESDDRAIFLQDLQQQSVYFSIKLEDVSED